jgi:hypothetical protein
VYTAVEPREGQELDAGEEVVIGLLRPENGSTKPKVSLGGK